MMHGHDLEDSVDEDSEAEDLGVEPHDSGGTDDIEQIEAPEGADDFEDFKGFDTAGYVRHSEGLQDVEGVKGEIEGSEPEMDPDAEGWRTEEIGGSWQGSSAGGCLNYPTCVDNPQFLLRVEQDCQAQICVTQPNDRLDTIGVYLLKYIPPPNAPPSERHPQYRIDKIVPASLVTILECELRKDIDYIVIPCTFDPGHQADFTLVASCLDTTPLFDVLPYADEEAEGEGVGDDGALTVSGRWTPECAGGCINYFSWKLNPQYILSTDVGPTVVTIRLSQIGTEHSIGYYVLAREERHRGLRKVTPMALDEIVGKAAFHRTSTVAADIELRSNREYVVIPCTFRPGLVADFQLSVVGDCDPSALHLSLCTGEWVTASSEGEWKGETAGGCRNHPTWRKNPQWIVRVGAAARRVLISLSQPFSEELAGVGLYCAPASPTGSMVVSLEKSDILAHAAFRRDQEVYCELPLPDAAPNGLNPTLSPRTLPPPDPHTGLRSFQIIPCTFGPGQESRFQLNVYAEGGPLELVRARETAELRIESKWGRNSCGGCANHRTWRTNKSHYLTASAPVRVKIVLEQSPGIQRPDESKNVWSTIGFYITKPDEKGRPLLKLQQDQIIAKTAFTGSKEVSHDMDLEPSHGVYVITPCTFYPGVRAPYALKIYADPSALKHIKLDKPNPDWHRYTLEGDWISNENGSDNNTLALPTAKSQAHKLSPAVTPLKPKNPGASALPQFPVEVNERSFLSVFIAQHQEKLEPVGLQIYQDDVASGKQVFYSDFIRAPEVSHTLTLEKGKFVLVPRLLQARGHGEFTLDVYSDHSLAVAAGQEIVSPRRSSLIGQLEVPDTPTADGEDPRFSIIKEILSTEIHYVDCLQTVHDAYARKGGTFTMDHVKTIFFNINVILNINKQLLKDLQSRIDGWVPSKKLGDIFLQMVDYLKVYSTYVNNYNKAMTTFRKCRQNREFANFLQDCINNTGRKLQLQDYLIMPVQRIPRYVLLLQQLSKKTAKGHADSNDLALALQKMLEVTVDIEEKKKDAENLDRLMGLQEIITNKPNDLNIVAPHRKYIREGLLKMLKDGKKSTVYTFLTTDMLLITKPNAGSMLKSIAIVQSAAQPRAFRFLHSIPLSKSQLPKPENVKGVPGFSVQGNDKKTYTFLNTSEEERTAWMVDFNSAFYGDMAEEPTGGGGLVPAGHKPETRKKQPVRADT